MVKITMSQTTSNMDLLRFVSYLVSQFGGTGEKGTRIEPFSEGGKSVLKVRGVDQHRDNIKNGAFSYAIESVEVIAD